MIVFKRYITPKIILSILLGAALVGMIAVLLTVNRINNALNTELGINKDSVMTLRTGESKVILPDNLIYASDIPGFHTNNSILISTNNEEDNVKLAHQYVSDDYFTFFNYEIINPEVTLSLGNENTQVVYLNESAVRKLGFTYTYAILGQKIITENNKELIIGGVVKDYNNLCIRLNNQPTLFQISNEHLTFAFCDVINQGSIGNKDLLSQGFISFQERIQMRYKFIEDAIYSIFLFINIIILLIGVGYIGNKFAVKKERELYKILGIGVHALTLIISKTYIYILGIIGFIAGPLAFIIQKFWLEIYEYRIHFGLIDLFIVLSIVLLTLYCVFYSKKGAKVQFKRKSVQISST